MKKSFLIVAIACVALAAISACDPPDKMDTSESTAAQQMENTDTGTFEDFAPPLALASPAPAAAPLFGKTMQKTTDSATAPAVYGARGGGGDLLPTAAPLAGKLTCIDDVLANLSRSHGLSRAPIDETTTPVPIDVAAALEVTGFG